MVGSAAGRPTTRSEDRGAETGSSRDNEEQEVRCPAGSFIYIPSGMRHGFRVGSEPSRKLNVYIPGAMVGYFDQLSGAIANGTADPEALDRIAADHGMEVVGPVPEGYL